MHHLLGALFTPLLPFVRDEFLLDYTQAGWLLSAFSWSYGISQLPAGYLANRIGLRLIMTISISGVALVGILVGISTSYYMIAIFLVFLGLLGGGYHPSSAPMVSELTASEQRGVVLGIHQIGGTFSFFLSPLIAVGIASFFGWRGSFITVAAITLVFGIIFYLLLWRWERKRKLEHTQPVNHVEMTSSPVRPGNLVGILILGLTGYAVIHSVISFIPLFSVDLLDVSEGVGAALLSVAHFSGLLAGPLGGYFADRFGMIKVMVITVLVGVPLLYLLPLASYGLTVYILAFAAGMCMYITMPVVESYIIGHVSEQRQPWALGIYYFGSRGGAGIIMPVIGYLIDRFGFATSFGSAGAFLGVVTLGCMGLLWRNRK